jgi:hypothetical protein
VYLELEPELEPMQLELELEPESERVSLDLEEAR